MRGYLLALLTAALLGFAVGRWTSPPAETELRWAGRWICVYHRGEVVAEYQQGDEAFRPLADATDLRP